MSRRPKVEVDRLMSLTLSDAEVDALESAADASEAADAEVEAVGAELERRRGELADLERQRVEREQRRPVVEASRVEASEAGDVALVSQAIAQLAGLETVEQAQAVKRVALQGRIAEIEGRDLPAAQQFAAKVRQKWERLGDAAGDRPALSEVEEVARHQAVRQLVGWLLGGMPVARAGRALALLPEAIAEQANADPDGFDLMLRAARGELETPSEPDPEPWHWSPIVAPDGKVVGQEKKPGRMPVGQLSPYAVSTADGQVIS